MKLAISNIAWGVDADLQVARLLSNMGVSLIDIAPSKYFNTSQKISNEQIKVVRDFWLQYGLSIRGLQSLVYGRPELQLFGDKVSQVALAGMLKRMIELGSSLGAEVLIFGSPTNRQRGQLAYAKALDMAVDFFAKIGQYARDHGVIFCIEPNAAEYGCDFVTTTQEGIELVQAVNNPGFGLHLDSAVMHISGEIPEESLARAVPCLRSFHASEPNLAPVGSGGVVNHQSFAQALVKIGYQGVVCIEMREVEQESLERVVEAVDWVGQIYK